MAEEPTNFEPYYSKNEVWQIKIAYSTIAMMIGFVLGLVVTGV